MRLDRCELGERFRDRRPAMRISQVVENLEHFQIHVVAGVLTLGIEIGGNYLVDAGRGTALDFQLGRELRCQVFVEELPSAIDLDAKEITSYNRNDHAFSDGLQELAALLRVVGH
jgi:hypothetical protein